jgi:tetratricopeptide (TPR) repeat protein
MYSERNLFEEAQRWYHNALEIDAGYAAAHNGLGLLFKQQKRYEEALKAFSKAGELDPTEPLYPRNIGDMYRERNLFEEAQRWYHNALEIDRDMRCSQRPRAAVQAAKALRGSAGGALQSRRARPD